LDLYVAFSRREYMNKAILSQDDYGLKMRSILFIADHRISFFIVLPYHEQENGPLNFFYGSYLFFIYSPQFMVCGHPAILNIADWFLLFPHRGT